MRTIYLYASENVVFYRGLTPSTAIVSCELVPGQTQVLPYEPSGQSSLNFAGGPDTREGCHYISASQTYLDLLLDIWRESFP